MDDLMEAIVEALFEIPFDAAMESKRLKTGVKTTLFSILGGLMTVFFGFLAVSAWLEGNTSGAVITAVITLGFLALVIFGAVWGHKRNWKK